MSEPPDYSDRWEQNSRSSESEEQLETDGGEEVLEPDSIEDENGVEVHKPSKELEEVTIYEAVINDTKYHITPVMLSSGVRWDINVYGRRQGPIRPAQDGVTDEQAADLGLSPQEQSELNRALQYAKQNLDLPRSLRGQKRRNRPLDDLLNEEAQTGNSDD